MFDDERATARRLGRFRTNDARETVENIARAITEKGAFRKQKREKNRNYVESTGRNYFSGRIRPKNAANDNDGT